MTRYLLDADAIIDFYRGFPDTVELIQSLYQQGETLCTCAVVVVEVYAGLAPAEREQGEVLLATMQVMPMSIRAARQAGIWRYTYARRGRHLATTDCLIAAIAHERRATLITGNTRDYPMPELSKMPLPRRQNGSRERS